MSAVRLDCAMWSTGSVIPSGAKDLLVWSPRLRLGTLAGLAVFLVLCLVVSEAGSAQMPRDPSPRAIRRDIPLTNSIRRAFAAGTRDSTGRPGANYWQLWTEYAIDARLDPATSTITGRERVVIHNSSNVALDTLVLRLDQNISAAGAARAYIMGEVTEGMRLSRLAVGGQPIDLASEPVKSQLARTSARVPLPAPIAPRSTGVLEAEWSFRVPTGGTGRMGRWGDSLYQVAQWYPRVAVFDDLRKGGWDTESYLGPSEFYNNYGRFDVRLDVPAGWLVGASGVLENPEDVISPTARERLSHVLESDSVCAIVAAGEAGTMADTGPAGAASGRLVWHLVADSVSDFAWSTSSRYVWEATRATIPGRGAIPFNILYLPGHADRYARAGEVGRHALEFYSGLWIPYAYPQLTMVEGPAGGMEYPMFVMSGVGAEDHEIGHQWWPMMVGVNETWYGFMDEGFNQYMNILSDADARHEPPGLDSLGQAYGRVSGDEREAPLMWNANYGGPMYAFQAYGKAPMMLSMLGGIVGDSAVQRAMREYAAAWRFKHPSPWDFAFFMNRALGRDLGWFWYYWLFTTESVDGSIERVTTRGRHTAVTVRQDGQMPSPVVLEVRFVGGGSKTFTYPVDVWFGGRRTFTARIDAGGRKIEGITLDPGRRFPDREPGDNVWPREGMAAAAARP